MDLLNEKSIKKKKVEVSSWNLENVITAGPGNVAIKNVLKSKSCIILQYLLPSEIFLHMFVLIIIFKICRYHVNQKLKLKLIYYWCNTLIHSHKFIKIYT